LIFWVCSGGEEADRNRGCSGGDMEGRSLVFSNRFWGRLLREDLRISVRVSWRIEKVPVDSGQRFK
jgi:hypothetical protein